MKNRKLLLENVHVPGIETFDVYRKNGGYRSVEKALKSMTPEEVVEEVKNLVFVVVVVQDFLQV